MADRPDCPNCGGTGRELPDGNCGFDDPGALLDIECGRCGGTGRAADRPDRDLADRLDQIADPNFPGVIGYTAAEDLRAAAARLRHLTDAVAFDATLIEANRSLGEEVVSLRRQLDTLLDAIGDIEDLRYRLDGLRGGRFTSSSANRMERIADAVDALAAVGDPEEGATDERD